MSFLQSKGGNATVHSAQHAAQQQPSNACFNPKDLLALPVKH
jgi:hypothetical protein